MAGHGSPPPSDRGGDPARKVGRPDNSLSLALSARGRAMMQGQPAASSDPRSQASKDAHARIEASMKRRKEQNNSRAAMDADTIEDYRRNRKDYED